MNNAKKNIVKIINLSIIAFIIYLSIHYLLRISNEFSYSAIVSSIKNIQINYIVWAIGLTALNYLTITFYDFSVASQLNLKIPVKHLSIISVITFIINNNLGFGAFLGGAMRFRFFSRLNINFKDISKYLVIFSWVYWVGLILLAGITFVFIRPNYFLTLPFTNFSVKGYTIGIASIMLLIAFILLSIFKDIFKLNWKILFPIATTKRLLFLITISTFDWLILSFIFYFLLPANKIAFFDFFPIFLIAQIGSVTSHVPAGVGVFDSIIIYYLKGIFGVNNLAYSLILFRIIYFLLPMFVAILLFIAYEERWRKKMKEGLK